MIKSGEVHVQLSQASTPKPPRRWPSSRTTSPSPCRGLTQGAVQPELICGSAGRAKYSRSRRSSLRERPRCNHRQQPRRSRKRARRLPTVSVSRPITARERTSIWYAAEHRLRQAVCLAQCRAVVVQPEVARTGCWALAARRRSAGRILIRGRLAVEGLEQPRRGSSKRSRPGHFQRPARAHLGGQPGGSVIGAEPRAGGPAAPDRRLQGASLGPCNVSQHRWAWRQWKWEVTQLRLWGVGAPVSSLADRADGRSLQQAPDLGSWH